MGTEKELEAVRKEITKLQKQEAILEARLTREENEAKGINFDGEIVDIDFSDLEIDPDFSIEDNLADFIISNKRDIYDFDTWDNVDSEELNFIYDGKVYEVSISETSCVESTHDHRIMDHDASVRLIK